MKLGLIERRGAGLAHLATLSLIGMLAAGCNRTGAAAPANAAPANAVPPAATAAAVATTVPFVGCAQDGQGGPQPAPAGSPKTVVMDPAAAAKLAYYSAGSTGGVLAPRGWYCFGAYGSDGSQLFVAPMPIRSADVLSTTWNVGGGPAIQVSWHSGDTSGRFEVAKIIARVFPAHMAFAKKVIAEGIEAAGDFPTGAPATDKLTSHGDTVVEFETPANTQGLGTLDSRLTPAANPIDGVAILQGQTPDLAFLAVRLDPSMQALSPSIVRQLEADNLSAPVAPQPAAPPTATAAPPTPSAPTSGVSSPIGVVSAFYAALSQADGATASNFLIPEKRAGPFAAAALSQFYGQMSQPLRLESAEMSGPRTVLVRYSYVYASSRSCNGAANVRTTVVDGQTLIAGIQALNGC